MQWQILFANCEIKKQAATTAITARTMVAATMQRKEKWVWGNWWAVSSFWLRLLTPVPACLLAALLVTGGWWLVCVMTIIIVLVLLVWWCWCCDGVGVGGQQPPAVIHSHPHIWRPRNGLTDKSICCWLLVLYKFTHVSYE